MAKTSKFETERPEGKDSGEGKPAAGSRGMRAEGGEETTSSKLDKQHSQKVQSAVEQAWSKEQPERLADATFGKDQKGHAYRVQMAPVVRDLAKSLGTDANPSGFPALRDQLDRWEPDHKDWNRVKCLLMCAVDDLSDSMSDVGVDSMDDDFILKAPDLAKSRREAAKQPGTV